MLFTIKNCVLVFTPSFHATFLCSNIKKKVPPKVAKNSFGRAVFSNGSKPAKISILFHKNYSPRNLYQMTLVRNYLDTFSKNATTCKEPILAKLIILHENLLSKFGKESESACLDIESGLS